MKTIKFIAACALLTGAGAVFSHEKTEQGHAHGSHGAPATAAQTAWGKPGTASAVQRTVTLRMVDGMRFLPDHIAVKQGETLRLRVDNAGQLLHEIVLGTPATLEAHARQMRESPAMEHHAPYMAHVQPGQRGDLLWQFNRAGTFAYACLVAGHYEAGMRGTITVTP